MHLHRVKQRKILWGGEDFADGAVGDVEVGEDGEAAADADFRVGGPVGVGQRVAGNDFRRGRGFFIHVEAVKGQAQNGIAAISRIHAGGQVGIGFGPGELQAGEDGEAVVVFAQQDMHGLVAANGEAGGYCYGVLGKAQGDVAAPEGVVGVHGAHAELEGAAVAQHVFAAQDHAAGDSQLQTDDEGQQSQ